MELTDEMRAAIKANLTAKPSKKSHVSAYTYRYNGGRPHYSDALGVSPDQVQEAREHLRSHGIAADFTEDGRCIITSEKQFKEVAQAGGLFSGRDGYGAKDKDGNRILTGREPARGRARLREMLKKEMRGYPSDYTGPLTRER